MALDNAKNFAKATVSTGYDASATSVVLSAGHGAKLPTPPFNLTWWNFTDYPDPSDDPNVEIVRCTALNTDTLTVTRAQESTAASTKNTATKTYKMLATITAKVLNSDISGLSPIQTVTVALTAAQILTLPTIGADLVAAPGPRKLLVMHRAFAVAQGVSVAANPGHYPDDEAHTKFVALYTNVELTNAYAAILYGPLQNESASNNTANSYYNGFFRVGQETILTFTPWTANTAAGFDGGLAMGECCNMPLTLFASNGSLGDFTGGDVGNSMKVVIQYSVVDFN